MAAKNYIIAIGGTGARCLEAAGYLAAAGLLDKPLHILMIDPDQDNGNINRTRTLLPRYHQLHLCMQPQGAKQGGLGFGKWELNPQTIFRASINLDEADVTTQIPYFWQDPNDANREFREAIDYSHLSPAFKQFVDLFYEDKDLKMKLGKGYRGRPNIGAVTLISDLQRTAQTKGKGLQEIINSIRTDLLAGEVRVFVFGSVFGGTGAAGLPTIPELVRDIYREAGHHEKLRFGAAMMAPYFTFPKPTSADKDGPAPDSDIHQVATQAALLHYSREMPGYQHVYLIGAPSLQETNPNHKAGGNEQENKAHYAEIVAGLAARDFFALPSIDAKARQLHYADGLHFSWHTLPSSAEDRKEIKLKLLAFTTLAYLYHNILHYDCSNKKWYSEQAWYRDNFINHGGLTLDNQGENLTILNQFFQSYLEWLAMIGEPIKDEAHPPFNWSALQARGDDALWQLGRLTEQEQEAGGAPQYSKNSYGKLMELVNKLRLDYGGQSHPVGVLLYLLHEASSRFCVKNYQLLPNQRSWRSAQ